MKALVLSAHQNSELILSTSTIGRTNSLYSVEASFVARPLLQANASTLSNASNKI